MTTRALSITSRDFASIRAELEAVTREVGPEFWTDFFQSNLGSTLMDQLALIGDLVSYGQDSALLETFLSTCRRFESALRWAKSVGYHPRAAQAASVVLTSGDLPSALVSLGGTIPTGTVVMGNNGLPYQLLNAVAIPAGSSRVKLPLSQSVSQTEAFNPSAKPYQTITTSASVVEQDSWLVYIGSVSPSNLWREVDNVDLEATASKTYQTELDPLGRLVLRFGNGTHGKIPDQTINVLSRTTSGALGNTPSGTITGNVVVSLTGSGTVTVTFRNDDQPDNSQVVNGIAFEAQGTTIADATQTGTLLYAPAVAGSVVITFDLPTPGNKIVITDTGNGTFGITTATGTVAGIAIVSSAIAYTSVEWTVTFDAALEVGGTTSATYSALQVADVGALISGSAFGGEDRESVEEIQRGVPAYIASQGRVIYKDDFKAAAEKISGVARAYVDVVAASYTGNYVRTSVWQSETVNFSATASGLTSVVPYTRYRQGELALSQTVSEALRLKTSVGVNNIVALPTMLWVDLYFRQVFYDPAYDVTALHAAFVAAVVGVFQASSGFVVRLADLSPAILAVEGIRYFTLDRVAAGSQGYSSEVQSPTLSSVTVTGRLALNMIQAGSVIVPGSVVLIVDQPSGSITCQDDGSGAFQVIAGVRAISSSSIDYNTGDWSITFTGSALTPSRPVTASYSDVLLDYRASQLAKIGDLISPDLYPPPGITLVTDPVAPPYYDGRPLTVFRAGTDVTATVPYQVGDETRYAPLRDISSPQLSGAVHQYNSQFYYNGEILYDSADGITPAVRAINLRALKFALSPVN